MKKRLQPTIIAFLVLVILLVYANYYEVDEVMPPGMQKPREILKLAPDKIDAISWESNGKTQLKLTKNEGKFEIVEPGKFAVETAEIEGIIRHFTELKSELVVVENATDTASFALNENSPQVKIQAGNDIRALKLGAKSPVGGSYYLAVVGDPAVYLVPGYIRGDFYKSIHDLRQREIFTRSLGNVDRIELGSGAEKIVLSKRDAIEWYIDEPVSIEADAEAIAGMIQVFQNLRISRFVEDEPQKPEDWGFASPSYRIAIKNSSGETFAIETGEYAGTETYFRQEGKPAIHAILNTDLEKLKKSVNELRTKILPELELAKLEKISLIDKGKKEVVLVKKDKDWEMNGRIVESSLLDRFLGFYDQARVSMFITSDSTQLQQNGFAAPENCDSFSLVYGDAERKFVFGTVQGVNLSLLYGNEILVVKSELQTAFKELLQNLQESQEKAVISGN